MKEVKAILLLGPTGAGKTPLGREIEKNGFMGKKAFHFDFGENLRKIVSNKFPFPKKEKLLIEKILKEGRLLFEEEFYLAEQILSLFLESKNYQKSDWLVLNGLPRNLFQAIQLEHWIDIKYTVFLNCNSEILKIRLCLDPAGDRKERVDDLDELVAYKLDWFKRETLPLCEFYKNKATFISIDVLATDTGEDLYYKLKHLMD
ncbi:MAG: nucleoside monophosphate kinase, partial [Thermodesulfobacteriaceae bacterium]|nr:nucleoside monophosphate kinase [Thermodesulfobacteriaceae bacterium]